MYGGPALSISAGGSHTVINSVGTFLAGVSGSHRPWLIALRLQQVGRHYQKAPRPPIRHTVRVRVRVRFRVRVMFKKLSRSWQMSSSKKPPAIVPVLKRHLINPGTGCRLKSTVQLMVGTQPALYTANTGGRPASRKTGAAARVDTYN